MNFHARSAKTLKMQFHEDTHTQKRNSTPASVITIHVLSPSSLVDFATKNLTPAEIIYEHMKTHIWDYWTAKKLNSHPISINS